MNLPQHVSDLFDPPAPAPWGLRGDPYLWREMADVLSGVPLPGSSQAMRALLERTFEALVGEPLAPGKFVIYVQRLSHGGMSSGGVNPAFWLEKGVPLLLQRYAAARGIPDAA